VLVESLDQLEPRLVVELGQHGAGALLGQEPEDVHALGDG
jgi:hypothetical protein